MDEKEVLENLIKNCEEKSYYEFMVEGVNGMNFTDKIYLMEYLSTSIADELESMEDEDGE